MKKVALALFLIVTVAPAQQQQHETPSVRQEEKDTLFISAQAPMLSIGISGGASFIKPEAINNQIEFNNAVFDESQAPVSTVAQWAAWLTFRPKNIPTFFSIRGELITTSRTFSYVGIVTDNSGHIVGNFTGSTVSRYSVYPLSINTGGIIPKTTMKMELGFIYAPASFSIATDMASYGSSKTDYDGNGYGFRMDLQQLIPIAGEFGMTLEFGYRYLQLDDFRDSKGRLLNNFTVSYSGVSLLAGFSYGF